MGAHGAHGGRRMRVVRLRESALCVCVCTRVRVCACGEREIERGVVPRRLVIRDYRDSDATSEE